MMGARSRKYDRRDDRGAALVLVSLVLVGLMAMAALVVDIGGVYGERREDQNAADAGALAAAFTLPNRAAAVTQAKTYVHDTLGITFTTTQWNSCTADAVPSGYTKVSGSNCIAFNGSARRALVRIPEQQYGTGFGRILGIDDLSHSAFAIAGLTPLGFGGVLPFGLVGQTSAFLCADSGGGNTGFCKSSGDGVTPGNFGVADFAFWGDDIAGTTTDCSTNSTDSQNRIPNNVAVGVDHDLEVHPSPGSASGRKLDTGEGSFVCPGTSASNSALTITGESLGDYVGSGLWSGSDFSDGGDARLQRLGTLPNTPAWMLASGRTTNIDGHDLDDIPLWEFIPTSFGSANSVPRSCWRDQFTGADGSFDTSDDLDKLTVAVKTAVEPLSLADRVVVLMDRCFTHYGDMTAGPQPWSGVPANGVAVDPPEPPCSSYLSNGDGTWSPCTAPATSFTDPVFSRNTAIEAPLDLYDIQYTPRFAFVPKTTEPSGVSAPRDFVTFFTIYIQRLLGGCNAGTGCGLDFDPGVGYSASTLPSNIDGGLDAMAVFVFPHGSILPNGLALEDAAFRDNANRTRSLVR
jgi:hypothetical protein